MSRPQIKGKVFGIGFHKTGTTSLGLALRHLGFRVCGPIGVREPRIADRVQSLAVSHLDHYDAFQDNPWPILFKFLDQHCPGSKFILTTRAPDDWIRSVVNHFGGQATPMREMIYGSGMGDPRGHETQYLRVYNDHHKAVLNYFTGREKDLLILRITEGDGWEKLCPFLVRPCPDVAFPVANAASDRRSSSTRVWRRIPGRLTQIFHRR